MQGVVGFRFFLSHVEVLSKPVSIPFFFEPNFDARVEPLPAALRMQEEDRKIRGIAKPAKMYSPVVYGEFLLKKVGGNYATGKGRYDAD